MPPPPPDPGFVGGCRPEGGEVGDVGGVGEGVDTGGVVVVGVVEVGVVVVAGGAGMIGVGEAGLLVFTATNRVADVARRERLPAKLTISWPLSAGAMWKLNRPRDTVIDVAKGRKS